MKCTFEIPNGHNQWRTFQVSVYQTKNGNLKAEHNNEIYIWKEMRHGVEVLKLVKTPASHWVKVGRVTHGTVFLGSESDLSYDEYRQTPEAQAASKKLLESFYKSKESPNTPKAEVQ
jgi:hypothetical protein